MTATPLPAPLPDDPLPLVDEWLAVAAAAPGVRNPAAMALATADATGRPAVRMVLLKSISRAHGYGVFYSHAGSRKGLELGANPRAAGVLYWEALGRQLRLEGPVVRSPAAESDAYFHSRPLASRISAAVSAQSRPVAEYAELERRATQKKRELGDTGRIERPADWGGYRLWLAAIEFWREGSDRLHERVRYSRALEPSPRDAAEPFAAGRWQWERLQP